MLQDTAVYDRSDLRFRNTNPRVVSYLAENFESVPVATLPPGIFALRKRADSAAAP